MKQNKALCNRTASAIHGSIPCFPGVRGLLASDILAQLSDVDTFSQK